MAEKDSESRLQSKLDTKYLVENFGNYLEATPHEIQNIFSHISEQAIFSGFDQHWGTIENSRGYEHMLVLEKKHTRVEKRIFHTTYTEILFGVDFVLTKMTRKRITEVGIQVKRNSHQQYFIFGETELRQLERFESRFPHGYYLFVDETEKPSSECFVSVSEVRKILSIIGDSQRIPNEMIREYCRGYRVFYNTFYKRNGGSRTIEEEFVKSSIEYAKTSSRTLVEIKTRKMRKEKSLVDKV